jgi:hypothetical protein
MSPFEYIARKIHGLSTEESSELAAAKLVASRPDVVLGNSEPTTFGPQLSETDRTAFGAITPIPNSDDLISSQELHRRTEESLRSVGITL